MIKKYAISQACHKYNNEATIIQAIVVQYMNMEIRSEILIDPTKQETQIEKSETTRIQEGSE